MIINSERFVEQVLPVYFKTSKYASFTRKLNRWGFVRLDDAVTGGEEFFHKHFQKNRLDLAEDMTGKVKPTRKIEPAQSRDASKNRNTTAAETRRVPVVVSPQLVQERPLRDLTMHNQQSTLPELHLPPSVDEPLLYGRIKALELEAARLRECMQSAAEARHALAMIQRQQLARNPTVMNLMGDPFFRYAKMEASQAAYSKMEASQAAYSKMEASQAAYSKMEASQAAYSKMEASQAAYSKMEASQAAYSKMEASQAIRVLELRLHQKRQLDSLRLPLRAAPAWTESHQGLDRNLPPLTSNIQVAKTA
jgi:hypothetical protein